MHGDRTRERLGEVWRARDRAVDPLIPSLSSRTMREYLEKQLVPYYKRQVTQGGRDDAGIKALAEVRTHACCPLRIDPFHHRPLPPPPLLAYI